MANAQCRFSGQPLQHTFVDLGMSPLANAYLREEQLNQAEKYYPLHAYVSENTLLVQLEQFETPDNIFSDYAYFSSYSDSWLKHVKSYTDQIVERFGFNQNHQVIEIASNDGYLLQYFVEKGIPVLGIEPAANIAKVAQEKGIPSLIKFFGVQTAKELVLQGTQADLLIGNNVLAHVPNLNDFIAGIQIILRPDGILTMEFPHVLQLIEQNQFDTIYHEHFSYFSFLTVEKIFAAHHLTLFDVEELPTHGGSLRIYAKHENSSTHSITDRVKELKEKEIAANLDKLETYITFGEKVKETKRKLLSFMLAAKAEGKSIVGYGAPAKGNTLLNYCGIGKDFIDYTVDRNPHKQGLFLPGTHIPIHNPNKILETKPDYVLIFPWNLKEEIMEQISFISEWGGQFVVPIPEVQVYPSPVRELVLTA
ncbi:class I SAM-dependent methyltransferase [Aetokthonos hydrillicola Thurmond2011]|jgi:2-polyprenyl-3-methyl-5-hydroxy-6-metoxy-1,4-benzoquinol methylase|uniref:Class I SAM-dependent methyltransferase n=1 Tax=Aetokthonos hydrillicola Thurmond2011 TaxID=2712845 RepID=A0AAP5ICJ3_9CYAN|nr:class I SAM-dependent methyltransferase [Aetokthonos hydrillicola]MBO3463151.1 class I SAM-dependent methyltransferase [Aetokthonos hydrillicola CCALA 1050]MBW4589655.1 class I SAM-dependent methyltransferase [Aetokthonos hydrillicola CCALA 1050]MDR9899152.1 class I SAM-dependent methyltransferase [Aetokthonos hydrillicola Thurmond2011]